MSEQRLPYQNQKPYKLLGLRLKHLRELQHETIAEVSGAVEIEPSILQAIEQGIDRPSEDILLLLINHFDPQEEEAVQLWQLAGYDQQSKNTEEEATKPIIMVLQQDNRVMYSDMVNVVVNPQGVVMNFLQQQAKGQPTVISRIGMSPQQAYQTLEALQQSMQHKPNLRSLPHPNPKPVNDDSATS